MLARLPKFHWFTAPGSSRFTAFHLGFYYTFLSDCFYRSFFAALFDSSFFYNPIIPYSPIMRKSMQRTFKLFILLAGTCVLLLTTAVTALSAEVQPRQQASPPVNTPLTQEDIEQFWHEAYPASAGIASATNAYTHEVLAKAEPDECYLDLFISMTTSIFDCDDGQLKVNEAYVWGLTDHQETLWFGTAPNVHCLVMGGFLGVTTPIQTDSYACQFVFGKYGSLLGPLGGDWRPPSAYVYDNATATLTEVSPNGEEGRIFDPRFVSNTLGIRSAATFGDFVFLAGPAFLPGDSINLFLFHAPTKSYMDATNLPQYHNIRKWIEVDGVLYVAVGKGDDGAILRYTGDPTNDATRWNFLEVGSVGEDAAEIALHDGRLFVNTWPSGFGLGEVAGLWMSPPIPPTGLNSTDIVWTKVFSYTDYEPDPLIARTYGGGAIHSFEGELYWGTMHVPMLATIAHLGYYGPPADPSGIGETLAGSQRSITIFKGSNFGEVDETIKVAYGMEQLPAFISSTWSLTDTLLGTPLYGPSGFDNMFNNYTWSMAEYDGQLFVGTMDWSYLLEDMLDSLTTIITLPVDIEINLPDAVVGADLYRFYDNSEPAEVVDVSGVGNYSSYGIRNMISRAEGLYLGMANPMNLLTDLSDDKPEGGWELIRITRNLVPLTVNLGGNGSGSVASGPAGIDCGATCTADFDLGNTIILTPTAAPGSTFAGWSGACSGLDTCEVELLGDTTVTANFALESHPLTVVLTGDGSGLVTSTPAGLSCSQASCSANYEINTVVSLNAIAFSGSSFNGWSGACSGTDACEVTIGAGTVVTANFGQSAGTSNLRIGGEPMVGSQLFLTATLSLNPITECTWDFGDGTVEPCDPSAAAAGTDAANDVELYATHTYTQAGVFIVIVTAGNDAGTTIAAQQIAIQTPTSDDQTPQPQNNDLFFPFVNRD
jgi:hypothetical protein